ncbi:IclR family transcriptional regulator [Peribacillus sp. NPDC097264]|uniref:IclR family transcriptional regulator n=1 Tax=Peribacillus sp. NPDC097264 TaxID=3390616 RepID=UPI003D08EA01
MGNKVKAEKRKYSVPALENAFQILKLLSRKRFRESTITEIATALSLSPASCYRILQSLEEFAIVRYEKDKKRYTLGPYLVVLGERAKEHLDYISIVMPYLEKLTKETGLTSILVNKVSDEKVAIIAKEEGNDFGVNVSIGRHFSITDGSFGMCFLAYLDKEQREHYLRQDRGLKTFTSVEIQLLEKDIERVRNDGYCITYGEYLKGICGIAAPIFSDENKVELSIALVGLTAQFDRADLLNKGMLTKEVADEISIRIRKF